jgi:hypothetical protein
MAQETGQTGATPPYISFATFKTFVADLKEQGVPPRIDRHVWKDRFAGGVGPYLVGALRFLRLLGAEDSRTDNLALFVKSHGTDEWAAVLHTTLKNAYGAIITPDLPTITYCHLSERFKESYKLDGDVQRKAMAFFINAAKDSALSLSPRILKKTRASTPRKRAVGNSTKTKREESSTPATGETQKPSEQHTPPQRSWQEMLLDKFPSLDPAWPDDVKAKWFAAFEKLMTPVSKQ